MIEVKQEWTLWFQRLSVSLLLVVGSIETLVRLAEKNNPFHKRDNRWNECPEKQQINQTDKRLSQIESMYPQPAQK